MKKFYDTIEYFQEEVVGKKSMPLSETDQTTLRLFAFKIALKSYVEAPHSHCVNFFLACGRECLAVGKKIITRVLGKIYQR